MEAERELFAFQATQWPWRFTFVLTDCAIIKRWTLPTRGNEGEVRYPLTSLTGRMYQRREFGREAHPRLVRGAALVASALCIYYSDFNKSIPLLAPFLALPGLVLFAAGASRLRQFEWTAIEGKPGASTVYIPHDRSNKADCARFEALFLKTMSDDGKTPANPAVETPAASDGFVRECARL